MQTESVHYTHGLAKSAQDMDGTGNAKNALKQGNPLIYSIIVLSGFSLNIDQGRRFVKQWAIICVKRLMAVIDSEGFRSNVGIVICNDNGKLLWAKRIGQSAWQFPQGGIKQQESVEDALYRELDEEVGLSEDDVKILHQTDDWLHYRLPDNFIRHNKGPLCIGQKQKWFLLSLESEDSKIELAKTENPEFDDWKWVNYWYPVEQVIEFKRDVYQKALEQLLAPLNSYLESWTR